MKRETANAINDHLPACEGFAPDALLLRAAVWLGQCGAAKTDEEGDVCAAKAAAYLVAYMEWRPK